MNEAGASVQVDENSGSIKQPLTHLIEERKQQKKAEVANRLYVALTNTKGINQLQVSGELGVQPGSCNAYFKGRKQKDGSIVYTVPDDEKLTKLAKLFNVPFEWLKNGTGPNPFKKGETRVIVDGVAGQSAVGNAEVKKDGLEEWSDEIDEDEISNAEIWNIIEVHQNRNAPGAIKLSPLCKDLGIALRADVECDNSFCGSIQRIDDPTKYDDCSYRITINPYQHEHRQRFTVAHEIAHWILHKHLIGDGIIDNALYRSSLPTRMEREANRLGAEILMPDFILDQLMEEGEVDVEGWARRLKVSEQALEIRLGIPYS